MAFTDQEIAIIKGMIARGDVQSHIAAYFGGSNGGRISEINTGKRGEGIAAAPASELPEPGPYYVSGRAAIRTKETLTALRDLIDQTLSEISDWEKRGEE
jgi:hypothetical protein